MSALRKLTAVGFTAVLALSQIGIANAKNEHSFGSNVVAQAGTSTSGATNAGRTTSSAGANTSSTTNTTKTQDSSAAAQTANQPTTAAKNVSLSQMDRRFITQAAAGGLAEVEQGNLAQQRATNDAVKRFAQQMVSDHTKANEELARIASNKGFTLPKDTDKKHRKAIDKLSSAQGDEFDRMYIKNQVKDHKETIKLFEKQVKKGEDADLKAFAEKTLPALQQHMTMVNDLNTKPGKSAGNK